MNQPSSPTNQAMNDGMREAINKSVSSDSMKKVSDMMTKTAKMLAMGHLDPSYMMETMDMMQRLMPENTESEPQMGMGSEMA
jgi:hypothetical protein